MAGSLNRVTLIGNVGADPEMRRTQDGRPIANFRVACSETWRDKNSGEKRESTEWISVVVFNEGLAKVVEQYVHKGSKLYVEGQFKTRKWQDQGGTDRYTTEVVLSAFNGSIVLLDGRSDDGGGRRDRGDDRDDRRSRGRDDDRDRGRDRDRDDDRGRDRGRGNGGGSSYSRDMDDEIPF